MTGFDELLRARGQEQEAAVPAVDTSSWLVLYCGANAHVERVGTGNNSGAAPLFTFSVKPALPCHTTLNDARVLFCAVRFFVLLLWVVRAPPPLRMRPKATRSVRKHKPAALRLLTPCVPARLRPFSLFFLFFVFVQAVATACDGLEVKWCKEYFSKW